VMEEDGEVEAEKKLEILPGESESCITVVMRDEDHTLGNALRYTLAKNSDVTFTGYSVPHPSESKMNVRIQTREGVLATDALKKGLTDLIAISEHILQTFDNEIAFIPMDINDK